MAIRPTPSRAWTTCWVVAVLLAVAGCDRTAEEPPRAPPPETSRLRAALESEDAEAVRAHADAVASREHVSDLESALTLARAASAAFDRRWVEPRQAVAWAERAVEIADATSGVPDADHAEIVRAHGRILYRQGLYEECRASFERTLAMAESMHGPDAAAIAPDVTALANVLYLTGDEDGAEALYGRALRITETHLGRDHPEVAARLYNLYLIARGRDLDRAEALVNRARTIVERRDDCDPRTRLAVLRAVANVRAANGDYAEAWQLYETVIGLLRETPDADPAHESAAWTSLGVLQRKLGDLDTARASFETALAIIESVRAPDHAEVGYAVQNLAAVLADLGRTEEARKRFERAIAIREASGPPVALVAVLVRYGEFLADRGETEPARASLERALALSREIFAADDAHLTDALVQLGRVLADEGEPMAAARRLDEAVGILETIDPPGPRLSEALVTRAAATLDGATDATGMDDAIRGHALLVDHVRVTTTVLSERQALSYAGRLARARDVLLHAALRDGSRGDAGMAFDAVIRGRALVLDEIVSRSRAVLDADDSAVRDLATELGGVRARLAARTLDGPGHGSATAHARDLARLRETKERLERRLAERSAPYRESLRLRDASLAAVRRALPTDAALLSFVRFGPRSRRDDDGFRYVAFVARGDDRPVTMIDLGASDDVDAAVEAWHDRVAAPPAAIGSGEGAAERDARTAARDLASKIWDPVHAALGDAALVLIVPDGPLHHVNPTALVDADGTYLLENGPRFHLLSAERDVLRPASSEHPGHGLLLVADARFSAKGDSSATSRAASRTTIPCAEFRDVRFGRLPETAEEADRVAALWRAARPGEPIDRLTGEEASEGRLRDRVAGHRIVHLATHGFFLDDDCAQAAPGTRGIGGLTGGEDASRSPSNLPANPLLRAGLALSGANDRARATDPAGDGILTAEEVASLDIRGTEWAVLSACDTGAGSVVASEGVFGLRRAFQTAGARTVITTLWEAEDRAAREWMERLYRARLVDGQGTADAVRTATLEMLRERRTQGRAVHPFYWAGWVAVGDWR